MTDSAASLPPTGNSPSAPSEADTTCALCAIEIGDVAVCSRCSTDQNSPEAKKLRAIKSELVVVQAQAWQLHQRERDLDRRRAELAAMLRAHNRPVTVSPTVIRNTATERAFEVRPERIRDLLLWAGAALIVLSGFSLAAVFWARDRGDGPPLITPTRLAVVLLAGAVVIALVSWWLRRRLPSTAEALAALSIGLMLVAWYVIRRGDVADDVGAAAWWSAGFAIAAALCLAGGAAGYQALRPLAPVCASVTAAVVISTLPGDAWVRAVAAAVVAVVFVVVARASLDTVRWLLAGYVSVSAALGFTVAGVCLAVAGVVSATSVGDALGPAVSMVVLGCVPAVAALLLRRHLARYAPAADVLVGVTTMSFIAAVVFVSVPTSSPPGVITTAAVAGALAVATGCVLIERFGPGVLLFGAAAMAPGLALAAGQLALAVFAPLGWFAEPWTVDLRVRCDLTLDPGGTVRLHYAGWALVLITLSWLTVAMACARVLRGRLGARVVAFTSVLAAAALTCLVPIAAQRAVLGVFLATLGAVVVFTVAGAVVERRRRDPSAPLAGAVLVAIPASGWAATNRWTTVAALIVSVIVLSLLAICARRVELRAVAVAGACACMLGAVTTLPLAVGASAATTGVILGVAGGALIVVGSHASIAVWDRLVITGAGALSLMFAVVLAAPSVAHIAVLLTTTTVLLAVASTGSSNQVWYRWAAGAAALGSLLTWFAAAEVTLVEAYSVPISLAALLAGAALRGDRQIGSWVAYGPGIAVGLGPSLVMVLGSGSVARLLLLVAAALLTIALGARAGLQAPIVLGAVTLLTLAVDALAPLATDMPRWIPIGAAGVLLFWLGATFERRMAALRRLRATFRGLG